MAAAKTLRCATCARQVHPGVARPARLNYTADFNDEVAIDCFELKDATGKAWSFFSIVDIGTTFHIAGLLADHRSETMGESFMQLWCCWAGPPNKVRIDMERGFGAHFQTLMDKLGCLVHPVAGQAPWQHGRAERQGGWWKELARRTIEHTQAAGREDMMILAAATSGAKNSLRRRCGFSPEQWVWGRDARIPADLIDGSGDIASHDAVLHDKPFSRRVLLRTAARRAFMEMQNDNGLRKALLGRTRVKPASYAPGDLAHYYRKGNGYGVKTGTWRGPAVVVGHQGVNHWLAHGGFTQLVVPEHLRPADPEELWWPLGADATTDPEVEVREAGDNLQAQPEFEDLRDDRGDEPRGPVER